MTSSLQVLRSYFLFVAALLILGGCVETLQGVPGDTPPSLAGRIIFTESTQFGGQVISINADSTDPQIISSNGEMFNEPAGNRIVFIDEVGQIGVANIDGTDPILVPLFFVDGVVESASISSTGQIAYSFRPNNGTDIFLKLTDITGSFDNVLTNQFDNETSPAFSPDGSKLAMYVISDSIGPNLEALTDVAVVNLLSGSYPLEIVSEYAFDGADDRFATLDWSSDGTKLLYHSEDNLYLYDDVAQSTRFLTYGTQGSFSPDGQRVAFSNGSFKLGRNTDIYTINVDGTSLQRLTETPMTLDVFPTWSPDNKWVLAAAYSFDEGIAELHAIDVQDPTRIQRYGNQVLRGFWIEGPFF